MSKSRREQIEEAARNHWLNNKGDQAELDFIVGAKWADSRPQSYEAFRAETDEIITKLQAKLAVAVEALGYLPCEYIAVSEDGKIIDREHFRKCRKCEVLTKLKGGGS
jgi:hypothetical protein